VRNYAATLLWEEYAMVGTSLSVIIRGKAKDAVFIKRPSSTGI